MRLGTVEIRISTLQEIWPCDDIYDDDDLFAGSDEGNTPSRARRQDRDRETRGPRLGIGRRWNRKLRKVFNKIRRRADREAVEAEAGE